MTAVARSGCACPSQVLLGVDLVMVSQVADSIAEFGERYLRRVFTAGERGVCVTVTGDPDVPRLAARFAAKEAVIKALGTSSETELTNIEVSTDEEGRPSLNLVGRYQTEIAQLGNPSLALSMSHDGAYATATVVILAHPPSTATEIEQ